MWLRWPVQTVVIVVIIVPARYFVIPSFSIKISFGRMKIDRKNALWAMVCGHIAITHRLLPAFTSLFAPSIIQWDMLIGDPNALHILNLVDSGPMAPVSRSALSTSEYHILSALRTVYRLCRPFGCKCKPTAIIIYAIISITFLIEHK